MNSVIRPGARVGRSSIFAMKALQISVGHCPLLRAARQLAAGGLHDADHRVVQDACKRSEVLIQGGRAAAAAPARAPSSRRPPTDRHRRRIPQDLKTRMVLAVTSVRPRAAAGPGGALRLGQHHSRLSSAMAHRHT